MVRQQLPVTARYANSSEFESINAVFNKSFQQHRSLEEFRWKFLQSPGSGKMPVAVVGLVNDQIAGVFALQPHRLKIVGEIVNAIQVLDVCVLPEFRNTGVNKATLEYFLSTASEYGQLAFGFPGDAYAAVGMEKLGYKLLTNLAAYHWNPENCLPIIRFDEYKGRLVETTSAIPQDWPPFFEEFLQRFAIVTERTEEYLRWRYQNFPHRKFVFLTVRIKGAIDGLAVLEIGAKEYGDPVRIYELASRESSTATALLQEIIQNYAIGQLRHVFYWGTPLACFNNEMISVKFRRCEHGLNRVVGVVLNEANRNLVRCFDSNEWYLTLGDTDL